MNNATARRGLGRGRPSIEQATSIDNSILATASELFLRDGFDLVTMEAISVATPISKTTLYSRYPSKEVLLRAVINNRLESWSQTSKQTDHLMPEDMGGRLLYHAQAITKSLYAPEVKGFVRLTYLLAERYPELAQTMYDGYQYSFQFVATDIEVTSRRENRPVRDARSVAQHFVSAIIGWNMQEAARGGASQAEAQAAATRLTDLFLAARASW